VMLSISPHPGEHRTESVATACSTATAPARQFLGDRVVQESEESEVPLLSGHVDVSLGS
jgi:hypothetical protein